MRTESPGARRSALALLIVSLIIGRTTTWAQGLAPAEAGGLTPAAQRALDELRAAVGDSFTVETDPRLGTVRRVRGSIPSPAGADLHPATLAAAFLECHGAIFGLADMAGDLVDERTFSSLGGHHARYRQSIAGIEVAGAELALHFDTSGRLVSAINTLSTLAPVGTWRQDPAAVLARARAFVKAGGQRLPRSPDGATRAWLSGTDGRMSAVWRIDTTSQPTPGTLDAPLGAYEVWVDDATGEVISARNLLCMATGTGLVFAPNPVVVMQDPTLTNMSDACYAEMMAARTSVTLENLDTSGTLTGTYVSTASSSVARANSPTRDFSYCRDSSFFSEVMVYYHIDTEQTWIQSLGFTNINNRQQVTDPYGLCGAPNAFYNPMNREITYCRDGVDASEDADVILHEYGHSIQDNQVPGWGMCEEGGAMGEGFGDFISESASSQGPGSFQYGDLGDWFGTQTTGSGSGTGLRTLLSSKIYPRDYVGEVHEDGEIWSAALWRIWEQVGRTVADSIVLQSHFLLSSAADFMDGGEAIVQAEQLLYAGAHASPVRTALSQRGLWYPQDSFEPNETMGTARPLVCGGNPNLVVASGDVDWYTFEVRPGGGWLGFFYRGVSPAGSTTCIVPYSVTLFDPFGATVPMAAAGGITLRADLVGVSIGTYTVRVQGQSGARFAYDLDYVEVDDGTTTFTGVCGDCNGDGVVSIIDALVVAQSAAGTISLPDPTPCDVDRSGTVTIIDALLIAQYSAGLPVILSCAGGPCGRGTARDISCGGMRMDTFAVGTAPLGIELTTPGATHFYRLTGIPAGTTSLTIATTGTGDIDLVVARPGTLPGSTSPSRYPTSTEMRSTGPTSSENVTLTGATIYTPADFHGGPLSFAITCFTPGSYTVTVTCN